MDATNSNLTISCPQCGQQFVWDSSYANRKLGCACGNVIELIDPTPPTELYEVREERPPAVEPLEEPPPGKLFLDEKGQEVVPPTPARTLNYRRVTETDIVEIADDVRQQRRDVWEPFWILMMGLLLMIVAGIVMTQAGSSSAGEVAGNLLLRLTWEIGMTMVAGLVIHWIIGTALGDTRPACFKLTAMAVCRFAISAAIQSPADYYNLWVFGLISVALTFPLMVIFFMRLFEFDLREAMFGSTILTIMRSISYFGLWRIY